LSILCGVCFYDLYLDDKGNLPLYLIALKNIGELGLFSNTFILPITMPPFLIGIFIATIITRKKIKIIWILIQLIVFAFIFLSTWTIILIGFD
jgi:hypothetical protein